MLIKIVSGGQTGVDRAALDAAMEQRFPLGGWCPNGRLAEDGPIDPKYPLEESPRAEYAERTALNVRDSEGTLVLFRADYSGGTALTRQLARAHGKPFLAVDIDQTGESFALSWVLENGIKVLNIAGPRESEDPGIYEAAFQWLTRLMGATAPNG